MGRGRGQGGARSVLLGGQQKLNRGSDFNENLKPLLASFVETVQDHVFTDKEEAEVRPHLQIIYEIDIEGNLYKRKEEILKALSQIYRTTNPNFSEDKEIRQRMDEIIDFIRTTDGIRIKPVEKEIVVSSKEQLIPFKIAGKEEFLSVQVIDDIMTPGLNLYTGGSFVPQSDIGYEMVKTFLKIGFVTERWDSDEKHDYYIPTDEFKSWYEENKLYIDLAVAQGR